MNKRYTRGTLALAALLAGALGLPGLAAADGDRGWGGERHHDRGWDRGWGRDGGGGWRGERRYGGGDRGWGERHHHDHDHDHWRGEREAYRPHFPRPRLVPGISVFLNGTW